MIGRSRLEISSLIGGRLNFEEDNKLAQFLLRCALAAAAYAIHIHKDDYLPQPAMTSAMAMMHEPSSHNISSSLVASLPFCKGCNRFVVEIMSNDALSTLRVVFPVVRSVFDSILHLESNKMETKGPKEITCADLNKK